MALEIDNQQYSSPARKLVRFFCNSRNRWKQKCVEAKGRTKRLDNQVRAVERSRDQWKQRARESERRIAELEAELQKNADAFQRRTSACS